MRAIVLLKDANLELRDVPMPEPGPGQARVRIRACAVNRADLLQRRGMYPAPSDAPADIPGLEIAGEVDALGPGAHDNLKVGDAVYGIVGGGAYAEAVVVHSRTLAQIPRMFTDGGNGTGKQLGFVEAAAIPEAALTAYDAIVLQCGLAAGEVVLVHAVGSGVGTAAVQIARAIGAKAIGTARSKDKLDRASSLGMCAGIVTESRADGSPIFAERARELAKSISGRAGVDVVAELVGGAYVPESLASLAHQGRMILIGLMSGARADVDLGLILRQRLKLTGTMLRARPLEEKIVLAQVLARHITTLVADGKLVPIIDCVMPLAEAAAAMDHMASNASFGKIVLRID